MSHEEERSCPDDCPTCNSKVYNAAYLARRICVSVAVGAAIVALVWGTTWTPVWVAAGTWVGITAGLWAPVPFLRFVLWRRSKRLAERQAQIRELQRDIDLARERTHSAKMERIQLEILSSQMEAELTQKEAYCSALRTESLEMERLLVQRKVEQVARETRQRLEIACAAVEADRLEAAAWRMELTAKQLELKLNQADLFESLSVIEDNAQERIIAAYEQGHDHGKRGIVIPIKHLRHLKVVEESA